MGGTDEEWVQNFSRKLRTEETTLQI